MMSVASEPAPRRSTRSWSRSSVSAGSSASPSSSGPTRADGLTSYRLRPGVVVLPATTEEVASCMKIARAAGLHVVARGAGTGLSGGALPTGYDLLGVIVGSEGLLGIVTEVTLHLLRKPEATRTFFAPLGRVMDAADAVSAIIAAGILPAAIEMMDHRDHRGQGGDRSRLARGRGGAAGRRRRAARRVRAHLGAPWSCSRSEARSPSRRRQLALRERAVVEQSRRAGAAPGREITLRS